MQRHVHLPKQWLVRLEHSKHIGIVTKVVKHKFDGAHDKLCVGLQRNSGDQDRQEALTHLGLSTWRQSALLLRQPKKLILLSLSLAALLKCLGKRSDLIQELGVVHFDDIVCSMYR